jgi:hypothetical protein
MECTDSIENKMRHVSHWAICLSMSYPRFEMLLRQTAYYLAKGRTRGIELTKIQESRLNCANILLNDKVKARQFFEKCQALLKRQPVEVV